MLGGPSTVPEPDPGTAPVSQARLQTGRISKRITFAVLLALLLAGIWYGDRDYTPPDPAECATLHAAVFATRDIEIVHEMNRIGCDNPPYQLVSP